MKTPDTYGNTHTVYIYLKDKKEKLYIGKGKVSTFGQQAAAPAPKAQPTQPAPKEQDPFANEPETSDDLPF
jgi:hypothetical protein